MAVNLCKEHLALAASAGSRVAQTTVESDIIVPDIKPDILKVLQADSEVVINRREVQGDKVFVGGVVRMNVLYLPDNGIDGAIKAISAKQEFNHSMDIAGADSAMELFVDAEGSPVEYSLVNSRKLKIKTRITLAARLASKTELDLATGVDEDSKIEVKSKSLRLYNPSVNALRDIMLRERLEVPSGMPAIREVLKVFAKPSAIETKSLDGKAMVRGELKISALFCAEADDNIPEVMEHTVPFSDVLEIDGLCDGMDIETDYRLKDIYFEVCRDSDGDCKILSIEATLEAEVRGFDVVECRLLEDAYSRDFPLQLKREVITIEQLVGSCINQTAIKESIEVPEYLPDVQRMCECSGKCTIESITADNGSITVNGFLHCSILYLTHDNSTPACGFAHILPFCQVIDMPGANAHSVCEAKAETEHISCNITSGKCLEIRAIVSVSVRAIEPSAIETVSEILCDESAVLPKSPSMAVYFVQKGDTIWDIAKKYRTSPDKILSVNDEKDIVPGKCIYIFK